MIITTKGIDMFFLPCRFLRQFFSSLSADERLILEEHGVKQFKYDVKNMAPSRKKDELVCLIHAAKILKLKESSQVVDEWVNEHIKYVSESQDIGMLFPAPFESWKHRFDAWVKVQCVDDLVTSAEFMDDFINKVTNDAVRFLADSNKRFGMSRRKTKDSWAKRFMKWVEETGVRA